MVSVTIVALEMWTWPDSTNANCSTELSLNTAYRHIMRKLVQVDGARVIRVILGHNMTQICVAVRQAQHLSCSRRRGDCIIVFL